MVLQWLLLVIALEICAGLKQEPVTISGNDWARAVHSEIAHHPVWFQDETDLFSQLMSAAPRDAQNGQNAHHSKNPADEIRNYIDGVRDCFNSVGMTITIVYKNQVILAEGFGFKDVEGQFPVDADTLFGIGSTSKAFTSAMAALAVSEKNLEWTKAIREYLPEFGLSNQFANERANLYDLLAHKVGLPRNDLLWVSGPEGTREEVISRLKYLEFDRDFRTEFEYNNWMVFIGGYLAAKSFGVSWEELITTKIFKPLNMTRTSPTTKGALELGNYALNYASGVSRLNKLPDDINKCIDLVAPAGAIHTSANDMTHWLKFQLNLGKTESGEQLIPAPDLLETRLSHFAYARTSITGSMTETVFPASYFQISLGLGWFNSVYRGRRMMSHSGATLSQSSLVVLLPDEQFGIFLSGNNPSIDLKTEALITAFAIDTLLGLPAWLNVSTACNFPCSFVPCGQENDEFTASPARDKLRQKLQSLHENLPEIEKDRKVLEEYAGTYFHPTYLNVYFTWNGQGLYGKFNDFTGNVIKPAGLPGETLYFLPDTHWKYIAPIIPLEFGRDATGVISSLTISNFEPNAPPTFLKQI